MEHIEGNTEIPLLSYGTLGCSDHSVAFFSTPFISYETALTIDFPRYHGTPLSLENCYRICGLPNQHGKVEKIATCGSESLEKESIMIKSTTIEGARDEENAALRFGKLGSTDYRVSTYSIPLSAGSNQQSR